MIESELNTTFANVGSSQSASSGFWADVAEDLHLPNKWVGPRPSITESGEKIPIVKDILSAVPPLIDIVASPSTRQNAGEEKAETRDLRPEEKRGLWILLGLVVGGWTVGGLASGSGPESTPHESP